jgi:DNA-binding response OmpR family regulator
MMKILVVHRQAMVLNHVKSILQDNEIVVRYTNSGLDGLLAARVEEFDLIICGTDLPVITGFELIRSLRTQSINSMTTVVFIADEIDEKAKYLGKALGVAGMFAYDDMSTGIQSFVEAVK